MEKANGGAEETGGETAQKAPETLNAVAQREISSYEDLESETETEVDDTDDYYSNVDTSDDYPLDDESDSPSDEEGEGFDLDATEIDVILSHVDSSDDATGTETAKQITIETKVNEDQVVDEKVSTEVVTVNSEATESPVVTKLLEDDGEIGQTAEDLDKIETVEKASEDSKKIFLSCHMLGARIHAMYVRLYEKRTGFTENVPESVWAYYCACIVSARLNYLRTFKPVKLHVDEHEIVSLVRRLYVPCPIPLHDFITGLGDLFVNGKRYEFETYPTEYKTANDGSTGWFGPINENTHFLYYLYPCLSVFAKRVTQDMLFTKGGATSNEWNLPTDIAPADAGFPTENLLGYSKSVKLTDTQVAFMENCGIGKTSEFPMEEILKKVAKHLESHCKKFPFQDATVADRRGNINQIPNYKEVENQFELVPFSQHKVLCQMYAGEKRFLHLAMVPVNYWCVYEFGGFQSVPIQWQSTIAKVCGIQLKIGELIAIDADADAQPESELPTEQEKHRRNRRNRRNRRKRQTRGHGPAGNNIALPKLHVAPNPFI